MLVTAVLLVLLPSGCTHDKPYYRLASARWAEWVADGQVAQRLILIGDAGEPDPAGERTLQTLSRQVNRMPERTTVVFLGDNVYERGMPPPAPSPGVVEEAAVEVAKVVISDVIQTRKEAEEIINAQIAVVRGTKARAIFVPGNHDWDQFRSGGRERILALEDYLQQVRATEGVDVGLWPPHACPGPVSIPLGDEAEVIAVDTQWWIEERVEDKATPENNPYGCPYTTEETVQGALVDMLRKAAQASRHTVVVGHHPLASKGAHGGFVEPLVHLFPAQVARAYVPIYVEWMPMPVLGSIVVGLRACCSPSAQDIPNGRNRRMRSGLMRPMMEAAEHGAAPLAYAAGHDHDLQVFRSAAGPRFTLVSGLGSSAKASPVGSKNSTLFAHSNPDNPGFMQIDFLDDKRARLAVIEYAGENTEPTEVYSMFLTKENSDRASR
jgi:hypothetical protein